LSYSNLYILMVKHKYIFNKVATIGQGGRAHTGRHLQWRPAYLSAMYPGHDSQWWAGVGPVTMANGDCMSTWLQLNFLQAGPDHRGIWWLELGSHSKWQLAHGRQTQWP
jgi:hypothetical protein